MGRPGARIDTTGGPVRITGIERGTVVELVGIAFDAESSLPALVIEDCRGAVRLDELEIEGGLVLSRASAVTLEGCEIDSIVLERASRARSRGGCFTSALIRGGSVLSTLGTSCTPRVEAGSRWNAFEEPLASRALRRLGFPDVMAPPASGR